MRSLAFLAAITVGFTGCAVPRFEHSRSVKQTIETEPLQAVDLTTFGGAISVEPHDQPWIDMEINYKAYADSRQQAQRNCEALDCDITADAGTLFVKATKPSGQRRSSASFKLKVPADCQLKLRTSNGRVGVVDIRAKCDVETSNGPISLKRIQDAIVARTSNGAISVEDCRGAIQLKTSNGRVTYSGLLAGSDNKIRTSNGAVNVKLDPQSLTELQTSTSNGRIHCSLTTQRVIAKSRREYHAVVGEGDEPVGRLTIGTSNGSISIGALQNVKTWPSTESEIQASSEIAL